MEFLSKWIAQFIFFIGTQAQAFWENLILLNFSPTQIILDILLVAVIFYFIFSLLKGSRAVHILIGLSILALAYIISSALQLVAMGWLLERFFTVVLVAIPIIFQQELRMALEKLGHTKLFLNQKAQEIDRMINSIVEASENLARNKTGALIVFQHKVPLKEYIDTGVNLDARVSKELLMSTFNKNSPLHDGAVIIDNEKILAASCILPHSYKKQASGMGTRHKAALGLAENTDASVIVISEEKGSISFAKKGDMEREISLSRLHERLNENLKPIKRKRK